jgi:formylglycine-generating enzyme required for sulfatase activity
VTKDQFQRFREQAKITIDQLSANLLNKYCPEPDGPWVGPDWYMAARYCNWLSKLEGLLEEQWCYLPNESDAYAEGMTIPANVLERKGYRLPTAAEWEYACRAGAVTSRYYGNSLNLLDRYAWYQANSKEHAWSCGTLLPNDLGLFDMLGNQFEWVQDSNRRQSPGNRRLLIDDINMIELVKNVDFRMLRGGSFVYPPAHDRSAGSVWNAPASRSSNGGFRPARTLP